MIKKIIVIFVFIFLISLGISIYKVDAKYSFYKEFIIANINIDTLDPKIELMNIKNTSYKENEKELYNVNIQIKVIESNIKINNINKIQINVDGKENENYKINRLENITDEIVYEINLKDLFKNQKIEIYIPKETIIDNSSNTNDEKTIKYEV